jgi:hypothetical protein
MHTVDLLERALALAERLGYRVRQEWLGGSGGGGCEVRGEKWLFLDLAVGPEEHLSAVLDALRGDPQVLTLAPEPELRQALGLRKSA